MPTFRNFGRIAVLTLCMTLQVASVFASPREELEETKKNIAQSKARQQELSEKKRQLEGELKEIQDKLVKTAESIQKGELELSAAEEKLRIMAEQLKQKNDLLQKRRKNLSALVQAELSLSHTPPEAVLMMPGDATQTMKAARILKMTSEGIRQETQTILAELDEFEQLKAKISAERDTLSLHQSQLQQQHQKLQQQLAERKTVQEKLGQQSQQEAEKLARLAKKAKTLQELLSSVAREQEQKRIAGEFTEDTRAPQGNRGSLRSFEKAKGHIRAPAAGEVVQLFGAAQGRNATAKGIVVATRIGAQVTAPYDGEVVFTGPFLTYGQLIIIRHSDDFHTLLAGLAKIDASVGQFLLEGEPIGAMGDDSGSRLYIELRKNNQPIDPLPWIGGLNKKD